MNRLALISLAPLILAAAPVSAQPMDHSSMPGMTMPAQPARPAKKPAVQTPAAKTPAAKPSSRKAPGAKPKPAAGAPQRRASPPATAAGSHAGHAMPPGAPMDQGSMPGMSQPPATALAKDHSSMPGMAMPAGAATASEQAAMPGMTMPAGTAAPQDHAAMPGMAMPGGQPAMSALEIPKSPPPPAPTDRAADRFFAPDAMAAARRQLQREHGAMQASKVMANLAEYQARKGPDGYRWDGQAWLGGDLNRFVLKSEGEGTRGQGVERAEVQALYSRAVGVYTDLQVGVRQDFEAHRRTYATVGFESLVPYWFDIEGAAFLSNKGELLGRVEGTYDLRLTNRVILQPRAEFNFAAQNSRATQTGSGLSNAELGLRLRYEVRREFAPYIGVSWDRRFGKTAGYARALGEGVVDKSVVFGVRAFF